MNLSLYATIQGGFTDPDGNEATTTNNTVIVENVTANTEDVSIMGGIGKITSRNTVVLKNTKDTKMDLSKAEIRGGYGLEGSDNVLIAKGSKISVRLIDGSTFQQYRFYIDNLNADDTILTIDKYGLNIGSLNNVLVMAEAAENIKLQVDDSVNLIHANDGIAVNAGEAKEKSSVSVFKDITTPVENYEGSLKIANEDKDLVFTLTSEPQPQTTADQYVKNNTKSHVETRAAAASIVNAGADFALDVTLTQAAGVAQSAANAGSIGVAPFATAGGSSMKYKTGSHVDAKGWFASFGVAKQIDAYTLAAVLEYGKSDYDSYVNAAHGEGDIKTIGLALLSQWRNAESGLHAELALRAGRSKSDYSANLTVDDLGHKVATGYKDNSNYYGASIGGGKEMGFGKHTVDVYGRYSLSLVKGNDVTTALDDKMKFDSTKSHRVRVGSRVSYDLNELSKVYAGAAYQYEFSGKAKATINGQSAPTPSVKGSSGMLEVGYQFKKGNFQVNAGVNGWVGKQKGVSGNVAAKYFF